MAQQLIYHQRYPGIPGDTFQETITDSIYQFPKEKIQLNDEMQAIAALILCEDNGGRYAFGVDPVQGEGLGFPIAAGEEISLNSFEQVQQFRITNDTGASGISLTLNLFYH